MMKNTKTCQVFLLCGRPATTAIPHPVLKLVPACKKCAEWYHKMAQPEAA